MKAGPLPLFPLRLVLFPGSTLGLKVFEARYLDLVTDCLRTRQAFGVVCLKTGSDAGRSAEPVQVESVGTLAQLDEVDAEQPGILRVRCSGGQRFRILATPEQHDNGLWVAPQVEVIEDDAVQLPEPGMLATVSALAEAIRKLQAQDKWPFVQPYRLDDAGWVANRWCELLPVSLAAKQKLMELEDPTLRLKVVDEFLRARKVVGD